jgi:TrmH family RNA methyltransferase
MLVKSKVKYIQTLGQKKFRQQEGVFIAEGPKLVRELILEQPGCVVEIFALEEWLKENKKIISAEKVYEVSLPDMERISHLNTPNQVLAIVKQFDAAAVTADKSNMVLALDNIQDPGNMGTIIRIADWFGISQVVCSEDTADVYNPKVVQATMGSIARVMVSYTSLTGLLSKQNESPIYAAVLDGQDVRNMKRTSGGILVIGNESKGISDEVLKFCNVRVTIPQKGKAESLNAAVATGIILSHLIH